MAVREESAALGRMFDENRMARDAEQQRDDAGKFSGPGGGSAHKAASEHHQKKAGEHDALARESYDRGGSSPDTDKHQRSAGKHREASHHHDYAAKLHGDNHPSFKSASTNAQNASHRANAATSNTPMPYNAGAVQKEIDKDKRIKGKEGRAIHALLKGRH